MKVYKSKYGKLSGGSYAEVAPLARKEYQKVKTLTKRQPYVRSKYFTKDKVFLSVFWEHLAQKHRGEKMKRLQYYLCALDLLRHTMFEPDTIFMKDNLNFMLHRFAGETNDGQKFYVQVKQDKRSGRKDFMSVFPASKRQK